MNLALVEKAGGRPEQAKESLLRALTIEPANAPAHFNLAALYEQSGENARAIEHYRSFLEYAGAEHARAPPTPAHASTRSRSRARADDLFGRQPLVFRDRSRADGIRRPSPPSTPDHKV